MGIPWARSPRYEGNGETRKSGISHKEGTIEESFEC